MTNESEEPADNRPSLTIVPYQHLDSATLASLIEEFVTRQGSVHGHHEATSAQNSDSILAQLKVGAVAIVFDQAAESCTIVKTDTLPDTVRE